MMKTKVWIGIFVAIFIVCLGFSAVLFGGEAAARAEIVSNGKVIKTVDLVIPQVFTVEGEHGEVNTVTVADGKIAVTQANCPDGYCMKRGFCNSGAQIVCLPNKLVIRFLGQQEIDGVVG